MSKITSIKTKAAPTLPNESPAYVKTSVAVGKGTFALRIKDDSMVSTEGGISYPPGSIIIVDPTKNADDGDPVVVRLPDEMDAVFGYLKVEGAQRYLKPLNPAYPTRPLPPDARIVGVVVQVSIMTDVATEYTLEERAAALVELRARLAAQRLEESAAA